MTLETEYRVGLGPVHLAIQIGNAQAGRSSVRLGDERLALGAVEDLFLGDGPALVGRRLQIRTIVNDINPHTDDAVVRYALRGGASDKTIDLEAPAPVPGGEVTFTVLIVFAA